jgi:hypothetical protein
MKKALVVFLSVLLLSCATENKEKTAMDSWIGVSEHSLIVQNGPPDRKTSDGNGGEVLIYSAQIYNPYTGQTIYHYRMYYANSNGIIYHWMTKGSIVPPQQMNIDLYVH